MNKNKNSKIMLILSILLLFIVIGTATAADDKLANETVSTTTNDDGVDTLNTDSASVGEKASTADTLGSADANSNLLSASNSTSKLKANEENYTLNDLSNLIKYTPDNLIIDNDFTYDSTIDDVNGLTISKNNYIIDFQNHTLDAKGKTGKILTITGEHVTIKNLKLINTYGDNNCINWVGDYGVLDNLDLSNFTSYIQWEGNHGLLKNSNFHDTTTNSRYFLLSNGNYFQIHNTNFTNIYSERLNDGGVQGAFVEISGESNTGSHLNFKNVNYTGESMGQRGLLQANSMDLTYCNFTNCQGGVIINMVKNSFHLYNSTFYNCAGCGYQGIIMVYGAGVNSIINNCTFDDCTALNLQNGFASVVWVNNPSSQIIGSTFKNTRFTSSVMVYALVLGNGAYAKNCTFNNNTAGSIYSYYSNVHIENCNFTNNYNSSRPVIVQKDSNVMYFSHCLFENNSISGNGSVMQISGNNSIFITDSIFKNNSAYDGGLGDDLYINPNLNVKLENNTYSNPESVYSINRTNNFIDYLYVNQTGGGNGSKDSPTTLDDALSRIISYGTIEFINNGQTYTFTKRHDITKAVTLIGNDITINTTTTTNGIFNFEYGVSDIKIRGFNFVNVTCNDNMLHVQGLYSKITDCNFNNCKLSSNKCIICLYDDSSGLKGYCPTVENCNFTNNNGSIIYAYGAGEKIINCEFKNNSNITYLIYLNKININHPYVDMELTDCKFISNSGNQLIRVPNKSLTIKKGTFKDNNFTNNIYVGNNIKTVLNVYNSGFINTRVDDIVFNVEGGFTTIDTCIFENNYNSINYNPNANTNHQLNIVNSNFLSNDYAISANDLIDIKNSSFISNDFAIKTSSNVVIDGGEFKNNLNASIMGSNADAILTVNNVSFIDNDGENGSAINYLGKVSVSNSRFANNSAVLGGALYLTHDNVEIKSSNFTNNIASVGGAIYSTGDMMILRNIQFSDNNATNSSLGGGAIFVNASGLKRKISIA